MDCERCGRKNQDNNIGIAMSLGDPAPKDRNDLLKVEEKFKKVFGRVIRHKTLMVCKKCWGSRAGRKAGYQL